MRKWTYILAFMACSALQAQDRPVEVGANQQLPVEDVRVSPDQSESNYLIDNSLPEDDNEAVYLGALNDSLHLPTLDMLGHRHYIGLYPMMGWGLWDWNLHEGLNVSLGTSVFSQFGRHAYHGVGFTQNVAAMYAVPLTSKLSLAVGGYYLYGQKSLTQSKMPLPIYHIGDMGDRIGAALKYNFNPSTSVELNVEYHNYPRDPFRPFSHYWP